ncbi:hypothetical protein [Rhodanobacter sp. OK091]|uniref:hypothetical protein n=1 Tax=Rhodanobacter sp. OK091 TaxID=1881037 RepID=UPI00091B1C86|nr:hypothetical protein [Rhodanobacter sp. OK091]SHM50081.1 hypothetical protein SAMN05428972_3823 [Rhodanobacter sp. OK091]
MQTDMTPVRQEQFSVNGSSYELSLFRITQTGELRLFVSKEGHGVGRSFSAGSDVVSDAKSQSGIDISETLFNQAKDDITRNEFGEY